METTNRNSVQKPKGIIQPEIKNSCLHGVTPRCHVDYRLIWEINFFCVLIFKQLTYGHVSKASEIKLNDEILSRTYLACQGTFTVIAIFDLGVKLCLINFKKLLPCTGENSLKLKRNTWWMTT